MTRAQPLLHEAAPPFLGLKVGKSGSEYIVGMRLGAEDREVARGEDHVVQQRCAGTRAADHENGRRFPRIHPAQDSRAKLFAATRRPVRLSRKGPAMRKKGAAASPVAGAQPESSIESNPFHSNDLGRANPVLPGPEC